MSRRSPLTLVARTLVALALAIAAGQVFVAPAGAAVDRFAQRLSVGTTHACAIAQQENRVQCWGLEVRGQNDVPSDLGPAKAVAAGIDFTCALKTNGRAVCWGSGFGARWDAPESYPDFAQLISSYTMVCALTEAGMRMCWAPSGDASIPPGIERGDDELGPFKQLSGSSTGLCGVRADDSAWCYQFMPAGERTIPAGLGPIDSIALGLFQACAVRLDGTLRCWGRNFLAIPPAPATVTTVKQVALTAAYACVVKTDATPLCWASQTQSPQAPVEIPSSVGRVRSLATEGSMACAIQAAGTVACWGPVSADRLTPPTSLGRVAPPIVFPPSCGAAPVAAAACRGPQAS